SRNGTETSGTSPDSVSAFRGHMSEARSALPRPWMPPQKRQDRRRREQGVTWYASYPPPQRPPQALTHAPAPPRDEGARSARSGVLVGGRLGRLRPGTELRLQRGD